MGSPSSRPPQFTTLVPRLCITGTLAADVRIGSKPEVGARNRHVRFPPDSDQTADIAGGPFRADSVEKVENAASAKFAQKRTDRRLRVAMRS